MVMKSQNESLLYEDDDVALFWLQFENSKLSVVTFTPRLPGRNPGAAKIDSGFGYSFFKNKGITGFYVVPKWNHWWQIAGMSRIIHLIQERRCLDQPLWTYGVSMGGNAALMFAASLEAEGVISFNPQASVAPKTADFDHRWMDDRNAIADFNDNWLRGHLPEKTWIFGDAEFVLDKQHVDIIKNYHPAVNFISLPFSGHSSIRVLMECSLLSSTVLSLISNDFELKSFKRNLRAARHHSPVVWTEASNHLNKRGSFRAALNFSSKAINILEDRETKGLAIDRANATLSLMAHTNNIVKLREKEAAREFFEDLRNNRIINHDFSWQKFLLANLLQNKKDITEIIEIKLGSGTLDETWFSALVNVVRAGLVSPLIVTRLQERLGKKILSEKQAEHYLLANPSISLNEKNTWDASEGVKLIFGPSPALRWSIHVRNGVVGCGLPPENIIGWGGVPIWNKRLFEMAKDKAGESEHLAVIVGDFLFGNEICLNMPEENNDLMQDGFLAISATALSPENDELMLKRGLRAVNVWHQQFGQRARFIFWCLFGRQVLDRLAGRYISKNEYKHPIFNYSEITSRLSDLDIVNLDPLLRLPIHEISRLFIDGSANPSHIGYLLLDNLLVQGIPSIDAYQKAVTAFEAELLTLTKEINKFHTSPVLLTGKSVWLDTFVRYMGANGATKLAAEGVVLAPIDQSAGFQYSIDNLPDGIVLERCSIFIISSGGRDLTGILAQRTGTLPEAWREVPIIDWEGATQSIIVARHETPKFSYCTTECAPSAIVVSPNLEPHMVELGPSGIPTWTGLRHVLKAIQTIENKSLVGDTDYRIEGDVLLSNGVAFLIGGNHSVLKYATGALKPTEKSIQNFCENIDNRISLTQKDSIPYLHVIFPDKQSVLEDAFPFKPVKRLGDYYLNAICPSLRKHVIYPADLLISTNNAYWPLDTHLTDHGSLVVLRSMLEAVGVQAHDALAHVEKRITRPVNWSGDLGNKFDPPLKQDGILINPDWEAKTLRNNVGFNDGLIDILLNPEAALDSTVLLFGDSFFRMMLQHLSAIFSRVICLRTRFMHSEILPLIKPDIVFTGNAERYLSNVTSDADAHSFFLYPYMRHGCDLTMDNEFLEAWAAITSSGSNRYRDFNEKYNLIRETLHK